MQKQPPGVFCKKAVLKNFAMSTGKHLCWSLFLIQNIAKFLRPPILKNVWEQLLLKMCAGNWEKLKIVDKGFKLFIKKKKGFFNISIRDKWKCMSLCFYFCCFIIGFLCSLFLHTMLLWRSQKWTTRINQNKIKSSRREYIMWTCFKFWPMENICRKL